MSDQEKEDDTNADESPSTSVGETASSWIGSWYESAKQKIVETNEFVVRDMKEFTQTVKDDTSKLVAKTATSMKEQLNIKVNMEEASQTTKLVTSSLSGFLGSVVSHVTPQAPDSDEDDNNSLLLGTISGTRVMSPSEARYYNLQTDPGTYCNEADNKPEFDQWIETFDFEMKKEEISILMLDFKEIRALYTKLVPDAVSHIEFWSRYFYKMGLLKKAEQRRALLLERADKQDKQDNELTWGEEDDFDVVSMPTATETTDNLHIEDTAAKSETLETIAQESEKDSGDSELKTAASQDTNEQKITADIAPEVSQESENCKPVQDTGKSELSEDKADANVNTEEMPVKDKEIQHDEIKTTNGKDLAIKETEKIPKVDSKETSSGDSSDWEKEFDLDMTAEEIEEALAEEVAPDEEIEGWEDWE